MFRRGSQSRFAARSEIDCTFVCFSAKIPNLIERFSIPDSEREESKTQKKSQEERIS
jgi:hypothetical protein